MEELLIEDKKYISSKRAAKVTGYAKDYIGQLCREGRVPAQQVGRSWYVLESAIKDHRFGSGEPLQKEDTEQTSWSSLQYSASEVETLPSVSSPVSEEVSLDDEEAEMAQRLQDTWKAWFDRVGEEHATSVAESENTDQEAKPEPITINETHITLEEGEVPVPVRTIYHKPHKTLLPDSQRQKSRSQEETPVSKKGGFRLLRIFCMLIIIFMLVISLVGTGYIGSDKREVIFSGIKIYNR